MVHEGRTDEEAWKCRQMLHFVFRWVAEEDRHAHCLELWLRHCGRRDPQALTDLMVTEGKKPYMAPHDNPTQLFTYTAVQEKATQLFYSCCGSPWKSRSSAPCWEALAGRGAALPLLQPAGAGRAAGRQTPTVVQMKDALQQFSMPLAMMMDNYKRKAIQMTARGPRLRLPRGDGPLLAAGPAGDEHPHAAARRAQPAGPAAVHAALQPNR